MVSWCGWDWTTNDDAGAILEPHVERLLVRGCPGTATKRVSTAERHGTMAMAIYPRPGSTTVSRVMPDNVTFVFY